MIRHEAALGLAVLALLGAAAPAGAVSAGTAGAQFLKFGAGARAGAMGDAGVAASDDAFGLYYNPATLSRLPRAQLGGAHSALFQGISYQTLVYGYPFGKRNGREGLEIESHRHALGLGIYYLGVGDIERRSGDSTTPVGTFNAADAAYALGYSYAVDDRLSFGATGKYISLTLDSYTGNAFAADAGVLYRLNPGSESPASVGAALRHFGSKVGYVSSAKDPLPTTAVLGAAFAPVKPLTLALDVAKGQDTDPHVAFGGEVRKGFGEGVGGAFRFGYNSLRRDLGGLSGVSAGAGLSLPRASFDFAWVPFGHLGNAFRFSLLLKF